MELNRAPGGFWDAIIRIAIKMSRDSAEDARRLLAAGFPGPAYVWAARSIEIFVKEVILLPAFLIEIEGEDDEFDRVFEQAREKIDDTFNTGRWNAGLRKAEEAFGTFAPMLTEDGTDVWNVWKSSVVPRRGAVVHGNEADPSVEEAELVVQWADQMMTQLTMRLMVSEAHPLHDLIVAGLTKAAETHRAEQEEHGNEPPASE